MVKIEADYYWGLLVFGFFFFKSPTLPTSHTHTHTHTGEVVKFIAKQQNVLSGFFFSFTRAPVLIVEHYFAQ